MTGSKSRFSLENLWILSLFSFRKPVYNETQRARKKRMIHRKEYKEKLADHKEI